MDITFSYYGFHSTDCFIVVDGRQLMFGTIFEKFTEEYEFVPYDFCVEQYVNRDHYLKLEDIPSAEQAIEEYKRQLKEKGVAINNEIVYSG